MNSESNDHSAAGVAKPKEATPRVQVLHMAGFNGFSTEDFLARVNINDKINNILRTPARTGVRQRSMFTSSSATPPQRYNPNAAPFLSARQPGNHSSNNVGDLSLMPISLSSKENSTSVPALHVRNVSNQVSHQALPTNNGSHSSHGTHTIYNNYDNSISARPSAVPRNMFNQRYSQGAQHHIHNHNQNSNQNQNHNQNQSSMYSYDNIELSRMAFVAPDSVLRQQFPSPMPPPPYAMARHSQGVRPVEHVDPFGNNTCPGSGPIAMSNGTIQLRLRDGIRIDMTLDKAVRVVNTRSMVALALSRNCGNSALVHPNGRVLQSGSKVEIVTYDGMKSNSFVRYAKMWYKGVSFTSESCALIYLVDTAGTRTTTDTFTDLTKDYTLTVFYDDSRHGPTYQTEASEVIQSSSYSCSDEGTEVYEINGFRITQAADGLVKVTRTHNKCLIRTSPGNGSATLTTPGIHCTASLGKTSHLFVRRNEKRMHFDGSCFIVRNAGHSAGFNENNLLIVY